MRCVRGGTGGMWDEDVCEARRCMRGGTGGMWDQDGCV